MSIIAAGRSVSLLSPCRQLGFIIVSSFGFLMANIATTIATTMICNEHDCAATMSMYYHYHDQHCKRKPTTLEPTMSEQARVIGRYGNHNPKTPRDFLKRG